MNVIVFLFAQVDLWNGLTDSHKIWMLFLDLQRSEKNCVLHSPVYGIFTGILRIMQLGKGLKFYLYTFYFLQGYSDTPWQIHTPEFSQRF